jgi:hypothetical protein
MQLVRPRHLTSREVAYVGNAQAISGFGERVTYVEKGFVLPEVWAAMNKVATVDRCLELHPALPR